MKQLGAELPNIVNTAMAQKNLTVTCSDGCGTTDGKKIMPYQPPRRPTLDEVPDILLKLRQVKPYAIKPDDQKAVQTALKVLAWTTIPATYDEAAYWVTRLLAHFPRRDAGKDGIVIADLSGAIVEKKISLVACCAVCDDAWREATDENPWMPPTGQLLKEMQERSESFARQYERLANPPAALPPPKKAEPPPPPYGGRKWPDFTEADKEKFWHDIKEYMPTLKAMMRRLYEVPDDVAAPDEEHDAEPR